MGINVAEISDLKELKAMAYDQIAAKEQCERNIAAINGRISELLSKPLPTTRPKSPPKE